jgi:hypothetical protein
MDSFLEGAKKAGYNSATPGYYDKVKNQVDSVRKHAQDCGVAL